MTSLALDSLSGNQVAFQSAAVPLTFNKDVKLSSVTMHGYGSGTGTLTARAFVYRVSDQARIASGTTTTITGSVLDYTFAISVVLSANVEYRVGVEMLTGTSFYWNAGSYASGGYPHAYVNAVATGTASSAGFAGGANAYPTTAMSAYSSSYGTPVRSIDIAIPNDPPNAPALTVPATPDSMQSVTVSWVHNDPDGDPQTAWEVGYLESGSSTWITATGTGTTSSYTIAANALKFGTTYTVRVRTGDATNGLTGAYASKTLTTADPNTYGPSTLSSNAAAAVDTTGMATGGYQYDVNVYDGEKWSGWVGAGSFTLGATIRATPATATAGPSIAPTVGKASIDAVASTASGTGVAPLYSTQHVLNMLPASATAASVTVEPLWTWLNESNGVIGSSPQAVINTAGWTPDTYQWSSRSYDGEKWSDWSDGQTFTIPATISVSPGTAAATAPAPVVGQSSVYAPSIAGAQASAVAPIYTTQHVINAPSSTGAATDTEPEPIWTWMAEQVSGAGYMAYAVPDDWTTGTYQFEIRAYDGELWGDWNPTPASAYILKSIRTPAATAVAGMRPPTIDAGALIPSAGASGLATTPQYVVSVRLNAPSVLASGSPIAPQFTAAFTTDMLPPADGFASLVHPKITPAITNVYVLDGNGVWQEASRSVLTSAGWVDVGETSVIAASV